MGKRSRILITTTLLNLGFAIREKEGEKERERIGDGIPWPTNSNRARYRDLPEGKYVSDHDA